MCGVLIVITLWFLSVRVFLFYSIWCVYYCIKVSLPSFLTYFWCISNNISSSVKQPFFIIVLTGSASLWLVWNLAHSSKIIIIIIIMLFLLFLFLLLSLLLLSLLFYCLPIFTSALVNGLSLKSEWQQVSSSLQDSSQCSGRSKKYCSLGGLDSSYDFQFFPPLFPNL